MEQKEEHARSTQAMALEYLMRHVPTVLEGQRDDGAFFPFPAWENPSRYHQYCLYPLAYLYVTPEADAYYENPALLGAVRASMRYMSGLQLPDGRFPHNSRGDYWDDSFDEWWTYFALETWQFIHDYLTPDENTLWEGTIRRGVEACVQHVQATLAGPELAGDGNVSNHFVWTMVVVHLAGRVFRRNDWRQLSERGLQRIIEVQQPGGYWHEGGGPTTLYNFVTAAALSIYALDSNNDAAWRAIRRAENFHLAFTYPNGAPVETIDGRVRYTGRAMTIVPVGFTYSPEGQAYVQHQIDCLLQQPFEDGYQGYAFFTDVARHAGSVMPTDGTLDVYTLPNRLACIVRAQDWACAASAIVTSPSADSRWWQDRQQHMSLWHRRSDLIIGGGNTKGQPLFSTLVLERADGTLESYLAETAQLRRVEPMSLTLSLNIGREQVELLARIDDVRTVRLAVLWSGPGHGRCVWQLPLWLDHSTGIDAGGTHHALGEAPLMLGGEKLGNELKHKSWRLRWSGGEASFHWPALPFNPYKKDGTADLASAQGVLRIGLRQSQQARVTITIR